MLSNRIATFRKTIYRVAIFVAVAMAVAACSSHKQATEGNVAPGKVGAMRVDRVQQIADTYKPWTSFYAPFSMKLDKPARLSVSGRATMEYGKNIHLSMRVFGIEVGVVYIDNDSAFVVDKFHHYVVAMPFSSLSSRTTLTLADIQSLMLGRMFYPGDGCIGSVNSPQLLFSPANEGENLLLTPRRTPQGATWYFTVDAANVLSKLSVEVPGYGDVQVSFGDVVRTVAGNAAATMTATGSFASKNLAASIDWNLGKAEWNGKRSASKPDLGSYKRVSAEALIKELKSL